MALLALAAAGCQDRAPIRIGFSGQLSGAHADLGAVGRDGAILAVEQINAAGGVEGRPLELVVRDDQDTPDGARNADRELIASGVVAIIGHMTSGLTVAALPVTEQAGVVLLSPTASTTKLSGVKDLFFRVQPSIGASARELARHAVLQRNATRVAVLYDTDNAVYTNAFLGAFVNELRLQGGTIVGRSGFASSREPAFGTLLTTALAATPDTLLCIASAADTAAMARLVRAMPWHGPVYASGWAQTPALLEQGGEAVEGVMLTTHYDPNCRSAAFLAFKEAFTNRFGYGPSFAAAQAHDAVRVLAAALAQTQGKAVGLPEALLAVHDLPCLMGPVSMDAYGDVMRPSYLLTVRHGAFVTEGGMVP
ncbi:MAG: ABC transporter substrate-binding protein [Desulfovibrionaceae bacterium]